MLLSLTRPGARLSTSAQGSTSRSKLDAQPKAADSIIQSRGGGAERDRTVDPLLAKQVLSQLSYSPLKVSITNRRDKVVGLGRFELPTSPLSGVRSNQLSYRPDSTAPDPKT